MLTLSSGKNTFLWMFEDYRLSLIYKNIHFYLFQSCNNIFKAYAISKFGSLMRTRTLNTVCERLMYFSGNLQLFRLDILNDLSLTVSVWSNTFTFKWVKMMNWFKKICFCALVLLRCLRVDIKSLFQYFSTISCYTLVIKLIDIIIRKPYW
jgi:hypothetical protein